MLQAIVGAALFLLAGYSASIAFFRKADLAERTAFSLALALTVPALLLAALNLLLSIELDATLVYWVLLAFSAACLAWLKIRKA